MGNLEREALELLRSPYFFRELLAAMQSDGLVGEDRSAQVVYIVGTSRVLPKPLSLFVKGPSSVGKNFLVDTVLGFFPPSAVQELTSSSARSWNYLGGKLAHKIVYVKERNDSAGPVSPTRLLISENKLVHWVTVKKGGRFVRERRVTQGPITSISTTTQDRLIVDDETRHVSIWLDETPQQTTRIMKAAITKGIGLPTTARKVWHEVQRLLASKAAAPVELPPWFEDIVEYVRNDNVWARRYFSAFLQACRTVALLRSFRRSARVEERSDEIVVKFIDFAVAALIFNDVFAQSIDRADDHDLEIQQDVRLISSQKSGKGVSATDLAQHMRISVDRAYGLLRKAASAGTVFRANQPSKANLKLYLPAELRPFLPDPEEVFQKLEDLPAKVKFVHPLTGEWMTYRRE